MRTLGIDPGLTGAWAVLEADGSLVAVEDLPVIRDGRLAWIDADALLSRLLEVRGGRPMRAIVERVHAMPRNGSGTAKSCSPEPSCTGPDRVDRDATPGGAQ